MTRLASCTQFHFVWGCLGDVHNHTSSRGPNKFQESGIPCIYVGIGVFDCTFVAIRYFDNVCVVNLFIPETGKSLVLTNMSMKEHFLPFHALNQNPGLIRDCYGRVWFSNLVRWTLVYHSDCNCYFVDVVDILSQLPACIPLAKSASLCEFQFLPSSNPFDGPMRIRSTADSSAVLDV